MGFLLEKKGMHRNKILKIFDKVSLSKLYVKTIRVLYKNQPL